MIFTFVYIDFFSLVFLFLLHISLPHHSLQHPPLSPSTSTGTSHIPQPAPPSINSYFILFLLFGDTTASFLIVFPLSLLNKNWTKS